MASTELISGLADIAERYDAVLCDVWGVIHNGETGFADAHQALVRFCDTRGPVVLITNAARPKAWVLPQLRALGTPDAAWSDIVTSGDVTRAEIEARAPGPVWTIGPDRDHPIYEGLGLSFAGPADARFISCTGLVDDETESAEDYRAHLTDPAMRGVPFICGNPDRIVHRGARLIPCAGAVADVYESLGGPVVMAGKPYPPIYEKALAAIERLRGGPVDRTRILAIGDGLQTDLAGAAAMALDCLFVTSGIHAQDTQIDNRVDADMTNALLCDYGASARYAIAELVWGG